MADAHGEVEEDPAASDLLAATTPGDQRAMVKRLTEEMLQAAESLEFERAASLRDRIEDLEAEMER